MGCLAPHPVHFVRNFHEGAENAQDPPTSNAQNDFEGDSRRQ